MSPPPAPPRFVPTLTEVVRPTPAALPVAEPALSNAGVPPAQTAASAELEEQMVQRVLQRVNLVLERRLREVVGQLILEHTQTLVPDLRKEIEEVVRQSVSQAFNRETAPPTTGG
ncbi:hypothetical protein [Polaromonas aquatica]|uniref:hypothetical protein n=1 Tax=Polaromonas aquatica TaxID=332657 RepID=UPI003D6558B3